MKKVLTAMAVASVLPGCVSIPEAESISYEKITPVTYDYTIKDTSRSTLWQRARSHFATVYGDSRSVIRLEDEGEGLIIGKGAVSWHVYKNIVNPICSSEYNIRFMCTNSDLI